MYLNNNNFKRVNERFCGKDTAAVENFLYPSTCTSPFHRYIFETDCCWIEWNQVEEIRYLSPNEEFLKWYIANTLAFVTPEIKKVVDLRSWMSRPLADLFLKLCYHHIGIWTTKVSLRWKLFCLKPKLCEVQMQEKSTCTSRCTLLKVKNPLLCPIVWKLLEA